MNDTYYAKLTVSAEKKFRKLEDDIIQDVCRRLNKAKEITDTTDYLLNRYVILGNSTQDIQDIINNDIGFIDSEAFYSQVLEKEYVRNIDLYKAINKEFIPYDQNAEMQQFVRALIMQSNSDLENITKTLGFAVKGADGKLIYYGLGEYYNQVLDQNLMELAYGTVDYTQAVRRAVRDLTNSGLRTIDYTSGHHNRVDVAARRALLTGLGQLTGKINQDNARELGTDYYEVSWHMGARPTHAVWQGKVYTEQDLYDVCGLDTGPGLCGWNCRHDYYPFIPGVSQRIYTDEWLEEEYEKESTPVEYEGKEYTYYEATQEQRKMETRMRAQREYAKGLQTAGVDKEKVTDAKCRYQLQLNDYKKFSDRFGLPQQRERIYYDLNGRVAPSQKTFRRWQIEQEQKAANREKEKAEMNRRKDMDEARKKKS